MIKDRRLVVIAGTAAIALLIVGVLAYLQLADRDRFASCRQGAVAGGVGQLGGEFTLTNESGVRVTSAEVFREPSLLYFGYTFCPDVCPLDSARNAEAVDLLAEQGISATPVFISVDPKRDTPEALRDFGDAIHPKMIGLTGSEAEIADVNKQWRNYAKVNDDGTDYYLVDHMTNTFLVLPGFGTVDFFGRDVSPEEIADRTACFVAAGT